MALVSLVGLLYLIVACHLVIATVDYILDGSVVPAVLNGTMATISLSIAYSLTH